MKQYKNIPILLLLFSSLFAACGSDDDRIDCTVSWQLYRQTAKDLTPSLIENTFADTFFGYWPRYNDNTVFVRSTTPSDVRSLSRKLASMADEKLTGALSPDIPYQVEVRIIVNYHGSYTEEVWSKTYM